MGDCEPRDVEGLPTLPWAGLDRTQAWNILGPRAYSERNPLQRGPTSQALYSMLLLDLSTTQPAIPCEIYKLAFPLHFQVSKISHREKFSQKGFKTHTQQP